MEKDVTGRVKFDSTVDLKKKAAQISDVYDIQLLKEYQKFTKNVLQQIDTHKKEEKTYKITRVDLFAKVLKLLEEEQKLGNPQALTV